MQCLEDHKHHAHVPINHVELVDVVAKNMYNKPLLQTVDVLHGDHLGNGQTQVHVLQVNLAIIQQQLNVEQFIIKKL